MPDTYLQAKLSAKLNALLDHLKETKGFYLRGWEIDFLKVTEHKRILEDAFHIGAHTAAKIEEIWDRVSKAGHVS